MLRCLQEGALQGRPEDPRPTHELPTTPQAQAQGRVCTNMGPHLPGLLSAAGRVKGIQEPPTESRPRPRAPKCAGPPRTWAKGTGQQDGPLEHPGPSTHLLWLEGQEAATVLGAGSSPGLAQCPLQPPLPLVSRQTQGTSLVGGRRPGPRVAQEWWGAEGAARGVLRPAGVQHGRWLDEPVVRGQVGVVLSRRLTLRLSGHPWPPFSSWSGTFREEPCWRALRPGGCQLVGVNRARGTTAQWGAPRGGPRLHCPETAIGAGQGSGPGDTAAAVGGGVAGKRTLCTPGSAL